MTAKVTIKDIAKVVGVASQNVSGVLSGSSRCRVSPATRAKILDTARVLGYRRNISARILRGDDTFTVAILLSNFIASIADEHLLRTIMQLISRFNIEHYTCLLEEAWGSSKVQLAAIKDLTSRGARRFVIVGDIPDIHELESFFTKTNCSFIQYGKQGQRRADFSMSAAIRELWDSFTAEQGQHFKLITSPDLLHNNRVSALQSLTQEWASLIFPSKLVFTADKDREERYLECGYSDTRELLKRFPETQTIMYHSDYYLQGGINYCLEQGLQIGQDIQLLGVNFSAMVRMSPFPLLSLSYPEKEFVDFLFSEVHKTKPINRVFEMKLNKNLAMQRLLKKSEGITP